MTEIFFRYHLLIRVRILHEIIVRHPGDLSNVTRDDSTGDVREAESRNTEQRMTDYNRGEVDEQAPAFDDCSGESDIDNTPKAS